MSGNSETKSFGVSDCSLQGLDRYCAPGRCAGVNRRGDMTLMQSAPSLN